MQELFVRARCKALLTESPYADMPNDHSSHGCVAIERAYISLYYTLQVVSDVLESPSPDWRIQFGKRFRSGLRYSFWVWRGSERQQPQISSHLDFRQRRSQFWDSDDSINFDMNRLREKSYLSLSFRVFFNILIAMGDVNDFPSSFDREPKQYPFSFAL